VSARTDGAAARSRRHRTGRDRAVPAHHPDGDRYVDPFAVVDGDANADADFRAALVADADGGSDRGDRPRRAGGPRPAPGAAVRAR
jgi:hypothetical protein